MQDLAKKIMLGAAGLGILASMPFAVSAVSNDDVVRSPLYRDGSISCTGADDTSRRGGQAVLLPQPGEVEFKVKLRNAQPDTEYKLAISKEPNCAHAKFYPPVTTDSNGDADIYGVYKVNAGSYNLLFDVVTTETVTQARNREIGTANTNVVVP